MEDKASIRPTYHSYDDEGSSAWMQPLLNALNSLSMPLYVMTVTGGWGSYGSSTAIETMYMSCLDNIDKHNHSYEYRINAL